MPDLSEKTPGRTGDGGHGSQALKSLLGQTPEHEFFQHTWQKESKVYRHSNTESVNISGMWNEDQMLRSPLEEILSQNWHIVIDLLHRAETKTNRKGEGGPRAEHEIPLIFQNSEVQSQDAVEESYGASLFAPYLNGCSVVLNHADLLSPWIAGLCQDLQKSFPHAYANCYLTPPSSQAVPPHADDRDVFIVQLVGRKNWEVYETVPILYPYPHEQVGKEGLPVPKQVLEGPRALAVTLEPGDVLYMPRGAVHQAHCSDSMSFHITVALATYDWTLAGLISIATRASMMEMENLRKSIAPTKYTDAAALQVEIDSAFEAMKEQVTAESIIKTLDARVQQHNNRAFPIRLKLIHEARSPVRGNQQNLRSMTVGLSASQRLSLDSLVRASSPEERSLVSRDPGRQQGLNVREEIAEGIMAIVSQVKQNPSTSYRVLDLRMLVQPPNPLICNLSLLSLAKRAVELGAFAVFE